MKSNILATILSLAVIAGMLGGCDGASAQKDSAPAVSENTAATEQIKNIAPLAANDAVTAGEGRIFGDVTDDAWYAEAVAYCYENKVMAGTSEEPMLFSPDEAVNRAMFVTMLYNAAGAPAVTEAPSFSDAAAGEWYSDAVSWAAQKEISAGTGGGMFGIGDPISREQLITILWRYDGGKDMSGITVYADMPSVSAWAAGAAYWSFENGIANTENGLFSPERHATRAEAAYMLFKYLTPQDSSQAADTEASAGASGVSYVYFTDSVTAEGLKTVYDALEWAPEGKLAVKVTTGEPPNSNYLRQELIGGLVTSLDGTYVESNTAYGGSRAETAMHYQVAEDHGFSPMVIMDEEESAELTVNSGDVLNGVNYVGARFGEFDSMLVLSHFKGHGMAGFGGAVKNISIGIGSSMGKVWIHSGGTRTEGGVFGDTELFQKAMAEAGLSVSDALKDGENIVYINVMNRLSVDCDCNGNPSEPDIHDIGILASNDPVALDKACLDLIWKAEGNESFVRRVESRSGFLSLEYGEEIGLGTQTYKLIDLD